MRLNLFVPKDRLPGRLDGLLRRLGPSWAATPMRRVIQTACFAAFAVLLFYVCWPYGGPDVGTAFAQKERIPAEIFLVLDPLVSLSTAMAARLWVWSLAWAGVILGVCLFFPRGFCAYVCPLGTLLDLFGRAVGRKVSGFQRSRLGWWVNLKYVVLTAVLLAAMLGVLLSGFVAAIPVLTRGVVFLLDPVQTGLFRGWYQVPALQAGQVVSIGLLLGILALCFVEKRFWCKYLCPTGAVFSVANLLRINERKVATSCIGCGQCDKVCGFAAIRDNYSTRHGNCSFCQTCAGVCPVRAIEFSGRRRDAGDMITGPDETAVRSRRTVLAGIGCAAAVGAGVPLAMGKAEAHTPVVRAPGSVPESAFLQLCIRCGQCMKVCPNHVLQPMGVEHGMNGLWTPKVVADWSGCEPTCNNCGQVCPTGAIRALPIEEKRAARMGLAVVDEQQCLPHAGSGECQLCADECQAAGYDAIEFLRVGVAVDTAGEPVPGSGFLAPVVLADLCVGCGLCQMRCRGINVKEKHLLKASAIGLVAGQDHEDRLFTGSYVTLQQGRQKAGQRPSPQQDENNDYLPDFLKL
ncbi:MAG: 4Fe-4S binding protein [Phycisphaerae bacterium]|nr:4Fe-4S binding protein [Phycisphaerae bacterium]